VGVKNLNELPGLLWASSRVLGQKRGGEKGAGLKAGGKKNQWRGGKKTAK